jgi:L-rhamnose mutarotase
MATQEVNDRWQREMSPFFESLEGQRPDQAMTTLPEIFHLD